MSWGKKTCRLPPEKSVFLESGSSTMATASAASVIRGYILENLRITLREMELDRDEFHIMSAFREFLELLDTVVHQEPPILTVNGSCMCGDFLTTHAPEVVRLNQRITEICMDALQNPNEVQFEMEDGDCWHARADQLNCRMLHWLTAEDNSSDDSDSLNDQPEDSVLDIQLPQYANDFDTPENRGS